MRARAAFLAGAGSAAILAIGWNAGAGLVNGNQATTSAPVAAGPSGGSSSSTLGSSSSASSAAPAPSASTAPAPAPAPAPVGPADGTYQGQSVDYQYGAIQVAVVVSGGKITDVQNIVAQATRGRDQAFPILHDEVMQAQSANISNLSGATYTTMAYTQAVQSALDAAGWQG